MIERDQMKEYSDEQVAEFIKKYVERQCMSGTFPNFVLEASERLKKNTTTSQRNESKTNLNNQHYFDMIKYEVNERHKSITPCPYGMLDFDDKVKMVGSRDCSACLYCFDIDKKKHLVFCATKTSTTYNIKKY